MTTRFERVALVFLVTLLAFFYALMIRSHAAAYSAIMNGEWVLMENGTVVADDYKVAEADAESDWITICEPPTAAEPVEEVTKDTEIELNAYEQIAARTTDEEWELLRWIVALECCDEPFEGQIAVVETILNRVLSSKWTAPWGGDTIGAVLRGKNQYSTLKYVGSSKAWATPNQNTDDVIAECIRRGPCSVLPSIKYTYFDSKGGKNGIDHIKIGHHTFGRDK